MSTEEVPRTFIPAADPAHRPRHRRRTARVILVDGENRTLLFQDSDPGVPSVRWWVTPGGGMDAGESEIEAAVREVWEETGYRLPPADLIGPLARRSVIHGYSDLVIEQEEAFYLANVPSFDVDSSAHTEEERLTLQQHRWWSRHELASTREWIWPAELLVLWERGERREAALDLGQQEESTVPDVRKPS